eukprot:61327-Alexandrium_andersonii.AAC.1
MGQSAPLPQACNLPETQHCLNAHTECKPADPLSKPKCATRTDCMQVRACKPSGRYIDRARQHDCSRTPCMKA